MKAQGKAVFAVYGLEKERMSMRMKRFTASILACVMASSVLVGCGGSPTSGSAATSGSSAGSTAGGSEQVTIKVANWDNTSNDSVTNVVKAFEAENPNIKVEIIDIPSADYTTKLSVMLNGGSDLDAFLIKDADTTKSLVDKGQLADLTDRIAADSVDLAAYNGLAENFKFNDKNYAMPFRTDYYVMFYNKDIFDAAGVAYPSNDWTWKDFEETAKKLTSGEGSNKIYGAYLHTWQACVESWGIQDGKHTIMDYQTGYDFFKPYYEMALRMQNDGTIQDFGTLKSGNIHYSGPFPQGTVGMLPIGTYFMATMIQKINDGESSINWGIATLPHPDGVEAGWTVGSTTPIAINAASKKQDAAWEFVKFATGEEGAMEVAKTGTIPGRSNDAMLQQIASLEGMPEGAADALAVKNIVLDRPIVDKVSDINQMLGEEHSLIMLGELSVDDGLAEMADRAAEIMGS